MTGHTNGHWKAVRKGVANAFSMASMRSAFDVISGCCDKLQDILEVRALASGVPLGRQPAPVNVDNMLLRESMDVISVVGFERSIGALDSFDPRGDGNGIAHAAAETSARALARGDLMGSMPPEGPARDVQVLLDATKAIMERLERPHDALKVWDPSVSNLFEFTDSFLFFPFSAATAASTPARASLPLFISAGGEIGKKKREKERGERGRWTKLSRFFASSLTFSSGCCCGSEREKE